ncbi:VanZ family protein [Leifsonia sp. SIMBA_070]|uniref:VanZ family protein n=1 Tax=Leifsonia sp. SIMBA_070 TaxID=3085810 RepID=UPI00397C4464
MTSSVSARPVRATSRLLPSVLFAAYLLVLVWGVLWKFGVPDVSGEGVRAVKLVPFVASEGFGVSNPSEMLANVVLFVPFGVYLAILAPRWRWWRVAAVVASASVALEVTQYVLAVGSSDVTDVILNTTGAVCGMVVLALMRRRMGARAVPVALWVCGIATAVVLLGAAALLGSPFHVGPGHGGTGHLPRLR